MVSFTFRYTMSKIIIVGNGVRLSNSIKELERFINWCKIPFVVTKPAIDILPEHKLNNGNVGIRGTNEANSAVKLADVIYAIGCSMATQVVGYNNEYIKDKIVVEINEDINETLRFFRINRVPV